MYSQPPNPVSDRTLEQTPARATNLLAGIAAIPEIRATMAQAGMTEADFAEGRKLLVDLLSVPPNTNPQTSPATTQRDALVEVDQWDEPNFQRAAAALSRYYPSAADFLFHDLAPSRGVQSVNGVITFLARVDVLEAGSDPARAACADDDKSAVGVLAKRGIDKTERARIGKLAQIALGSDPPALTPESPHTQTRTENLLALRSWYEDWSATARAVIRKRSHLIRLGLGKRRGRNGAADPASTPGASPALAPNPNA
jgi:hypothetical protein